MIDPFEAEGRSWPEPPEIARIVYVGEFSQSSDLGMKESAWSRIISFAVGARDSAMMRPMAVAVTIDRKIVFVADPDAHCVHRFDIGRGRYDCLNSGKDNPPVAPVGLAVTDGGILFVSDSQQGRLFQVAPGGNQLVSFEVSQALKQPTGLHWDAKSEHLYVTDTGKQSVMIFSLQGELTKTISERGNLPGQFNFPTYLWVDEGTELVVADSLNFRVQRFDSDGNFLSTFGKNGDQASDFARPKGIAIDSFGHVYVVDALHHAVQVFDRYGVLLLSIGNQGRGEGQFWLPNGIFITSDNTIFVADSYNKRIQVFRYVGPES